jgi:hypothetical protein
MEPEPDKAVAQSMQQTCDSDRDDGEPGCGHYRRRCRLVAPCCSEVFWCRHCHNESKYDGVMDPNSAHQLDRTQVMEVVCAACSERQPVAAACRVCANQFGQYFCEPCRCVEHAARLAGVSRGVPLVCAANTSWSGAQSHVCCDQVL